MDHLLISQGTVRHGMHFQAWDARIPDTDVVSTMLKITSPAEHAGYCDVDRLEEHQVSIWLFDQDGAPTSLNDLFRGLSHWKMDRRHVRIPLNGRRIVLQEGRNFGVKAILGDEIILDRRKAGA
jgi:hypothetical protein